MSRTFKDAKDGERCTFNITLKDKSRAQCGRKQVRDHVCLQHYRVTIKRKPVYCAAHLCTNQATHTHGDVPFCTTHKNFYKADFPGKPVKL